MTTVGRVDLTRNRLRSRFRELEELARCEAEAKAVEIEEGKRKVEFLELKIDEKDREVCDRDKRLAEVDVKVREERLRSLEEKIRKCEEEVRLGKRKISLVQKWMMQCSSTLEAREGKVKECNVGFSLLKSSMEEWCCSVEMKERELEECVVRMELKGKEVESRIEELELIEKRVKGCIGDFDLLERGMQERREELIAVEEAVCEGEKKLELARKAVEEHEKALEVIGEGLERKERELEQKAKEIELKEREVGLKGGEINAKDRRVNERVSEVELKERRLELFEKSVQKDKKHLDMLQNLVAQREMKLESLQRSVHDRENSLESLQTSVQERKRDLNSLSHGIERRERELEKQVKELELKQQQFDSQRKGKQVETSPAAENANEVSPTSDQSRINMDGRSLQLVMNEQVGKIELAGSLMSSVLQASSDPAKLVLDAMEGYYPSNVTAEDEDFESQLRVVRKSCILLLQELNRMSPLVNPQVREEAVKLAADWKEKMADPADNWEALGFLWLITTYELTSLYDLSELQSLLAMVSQPDQAAVLVRMLGISEMAPVANVVSSIVKTEPLASSVARNESPPTLSNDTQNERIVALPSIVKTERPESFRTGNRETLSTPNSTLQKELLVTVRLSSDPADFVLDLMQRSITFYQINRNLGSKEKIVSSNITLLKFLMGLSAHFGLHLKEKATNIASLWKAQLIGDTEDSAESLGYLVLIAMYGLLATLHEDEILMLLRRISQHQRSLKLCQTHHFADYIPDFIRKLIEKKLLMEAVTSICAFKLNDKLPPVPFLKEYVEDVMISSEVICRSQRTPDEKDEALNGKIADLRAAIQCIKDYNLESEFPSKTVEIQIAQLEMRKEQWRSPAPIMVPKAEHENRKRKKPCPSSAAPTLQPGKLKIRFVLSGFECIIQNLIETKQLIKAVTLICTFKQIDKFPLVTLLKEYVEDAKKSCIEIFRKHISHDEKEKVVDDQIADLKALIQCIEDHSLESQYPPIDIMMEIQWLGELKENPNLLLSLPSNNVEKQEQKKGRKRSSSSTASPTSHHTYKLRSRT